MGSGEKKVAALLTVVLLVLIGVYFATKPKTGSSLQTSPQAPSTTLRQQQSGSDATCSTTGGGGNSVATQEFGEKGAKMEIVAALPITHGCHVETEAQLKKAYEAHKDDVHLIIYDLFGPDGQKFVSEHGGQRAVVFINGKSSIEYNGKMVTLERTEDLYNPATIVPIIEQELKKS